MSVLDGELANDSTFNSAFMSREVNTSTVGTIDLGNLDAASGPGLTNVQRNINALASALGISTDQVYNYLNTWADNGVGNTSESFRDKIEAITALFLAASGHTHDGTDGSGKKVLAASLDAYNNFWCTHERLVITAASGTTFDVSSNFAGKTAGGGSAAEGVLTTAPNNKVSIVNATTQTSIEDGGGQIAYGRLTYSTGVWTLSFYTNEAGVETAFNLSSQDIAIVYREVFTSETRPTIGSNPADMGTLDITADIADASTTQRGAMSTGAQSFAGLKTFNDGATISESFKLLEASDSSTTGTATTLTLPGEPVVRLTNASLVSIAMIASPARGHLLMIINDTGADIDLLNDSGATAANRIITGTAADFTLKNYAVALVYYEINSSRWRLMGGGGGTGGGGWIAGDSTSLTAGGTITITSVDGQQVFRVASSSGAVALSATPFGGAAPNDGTVIRLVGTSDTNTVTLSHSDSTKGCLLKGACTLRKADVIELQYFSTDDRYIETMRNF